ncbi:MAG: alpha/beta hydrolase [Hyphomicrobiales bacterium]|nr:alpha/beta hydrolase [Hyphomicrobiales bacterium]
MNAPPIKDPALWTPLARFDGKKPQAPRWFDHAVAQKPQERRIDVQGAPIELFTWGEVGKPGLLLLHGNGAHAGWYRFIAPFFADRYRVAAMSWAGMGGSGWRKHYSLDTFVAEIMAAIEAAGLYAGPAKPLIVGHSFGSFPLAEAARRHGERFAGIVVVDSPFLSQQRREERRIERGQQPQRPRGLHPHRIYPTFEAALARFRLAPLQPCTNLYIADLIAREGLTPVKAENGGEGWSWRFDPYLWRDFQMPDLTGILSRVKCPTALIRGEKSQLMQTQDFDYTHALMPAGSPRLEVPDAEHHVMIDQPIAFVSALNGLFAGWPAV